MKLEIVRAVFDMWLTIWRKHLNAGNNLVVMDLFAGRGTYIDNGEEVPGTPLIFMEVIKEHFIEKERKFKGGNSKIKIFFIEAKKKYFQNLESTLKNFLKQNPTLSNLVELNLKNDNCNVVIENLLQTYPSIYDPMFVLIDPWGLHIKYDTMEKIMSFPNRKDILFNFILEGVTRASGVARKVARGEEVRKQEISTTKTLIEFLGPEVDILKAKNKWEILEQYSKALFTRKEYKVVIYDMYYPNREDVIYYLIFACIKRTITDIVKEIYKRFKEKEKPSLFGAEKRIKEYNNNNQ